jgi:hypothetical protein
MTASPLLPPGVAGPMAETEATDAELSRMTELALSRRTHNQVGAYPHRSGMQRAI